MKRKLSIILLALVAAMSVQSAMAWSTWGHHVSAYIAEQHLTPEAKAKCEHYLKHSLPHYSSWQDYWRNSHPFEEITHWHMNYVDGEFNTKGKGGDISRDAVTQLERLIKEMGKGKYHKLSDSMVAVNLKLIIHMSADMHCPCHVGYDKSTGLKGLSMFFKGKKYDRHKFWDAVPQLIHPKWKLDDFLKACDTYTPKQIKKIQKGTPTKWGIDNAHKMVETYSYWERYEEYKKMDREQHEKIERMTHEQLTYGGYRMAAILNKIFSK